MHCACVIGARFYCAFVTCINCVFAGCQDEAPLASLPLLGYSVSQPEKSDNIGKEFVFKLQFKTHVYFFRAESDYTFQRWMQVISSARQPLEIHPC
jgi:PH domain